MIKDKLNIFKARVCEATPACLVTMVQGNVIALTLGHWKVAFTTGITTGIIAVILSFFTKPELQDNKYVVAGLTGVITAIADLYTHPSHFGGATTESIVTGIGAALLCLALAQIKK